MVNGTRELDGTGIEMWGRYVVREAEPQVGVFSYDQDQIEADFDLSDITTEPDGPEYERQPLPEKNDYILDFDLTGWTGRVDSFFILNGDESLGAYWIKTGKEYEIGPSMDALAVTAEWEHIRHTTDEL